MSKILINRTFLVVLILLLTSFQEKQDQSVRVFMIGDSTMANKTPERFPETGWGQVFCQFFNDNVNVENHAMNGRSTKSFIKEGRWDKVLNQLKPDDYVFIQFGHNDQKLNSPDRYTNPYTGYRANLERFVNETKSKKAIAIILSPIVRRKFNEYGTLEDTHGAYPFVARMVAREMNVCFIDLQLLTENLVEQLGPKDSEKLFMVIQPGESKNYPQGITDNTHLNRDGALRVGSLVVNELKRQNNPLTKYLKETNKQ